MSYDLLIYITRFVNAACNISLVSDVKSHQKSAINLIIHIKFPRNYILNKYYFNAQTFFYYFLTKSVCYTFPTLYIRSWVNWEEFVRCQVRANETYSEAKLQFNSRNRDVLMNAQSPHKWWPTQVSSA